MIRTLLKCAVVAAVLGLVSTGATPAQAETLKLAHSTWVGYGPFYIAKEKGFFADENVDVELVVMENTPLKMGALMAGKVDMVASTADEFPVYMKPGKSLRYILAVDNSKGGDGVVANEEIQTVADLRGKTVAFEEGSVSQFFINALLREAGLGQDDIDMVNMTATDAGMAFTARRVDAAVTWEPHLSQGARSEHGHRLIDSSQRPGLIVDVIAVLDTTARERREELAGFVRAWNRALAYLAAHPEESHRLMAEGVGGWLEDPAVFAETLGGIEYLDLAANRDLFGTAAAPGQLYTTVGYAIDIWSGFGKVQVEIEPDDLIDHSFIDG
jgi:NitT/TauT family transport system substrate-binding protein